MADLFLNFKDFDHHSSDDKTTTLQHKKLGHKLVLAHGALSDKHRKALEDFKKAKAPEQMAKGGEAKKPEETLNYKDLMQQKKAMNTAEANKPIILKKKMADGGLADEKEHVSGININENEPGYTKMAVGGMPAAADPNAAGLPCLNPHCKSHGRPHPNCRCYGPGGPAAEEHAEGGTVGSKTSYCAYGFPHHAGCEYAKGGEVTGTSQQGKDVRHGQKAKQEGRTEDYEIARDFAREEAQGRAAEERHIKPNIKGLAEGGPVQRFAMGTNEPVTDETGYTPTPDDTASPQTAPAPAPQTAAPAAQPQAAPTPTPTAGDRYQAEDAAWTQDLKNQHITPLTYQKLFADKSTPGKIATLFGLVAGGIGSGLTGQPNAAIQMMDKIISNDLEAQKQSKSNAFNYWNATYNHLLQQAQARGLDASSKYTQAQTATMTDALSRKRMQRAQLQDMYNTIQHMNPNDPRYGNYVRAYSAIAQAADMDTATAKQKVDALNMLQNDQFGAPRNSSIFDPHPDVIKPGGIGNPNGESPGASIGRQGLPNVAEEQAEDRGPTKILTPEAERKYNWALSPYNTVQSPEEKRGIVEEYNNNKQLESQLALLDSKFDDMQKKATWGGYLASKVNPHAIGAGLGAAAEAAGIAGAIPTAGTSLIGALPGAIGAGLAGEAGGAGLKQLLTGIGGQQESQYQDAAGAYETAITNALQSAGITPTEAEKLAGNLKPTKVDSRETALDKLKTAKEKMIAATRKAMLKSHKLVNEPEK